MSNPRNPFGPTRPRAGRRGAVAVAAALALATSIASIAPAAADAATGATGATGTSAGPPQIATTGAYRTVRSGTTTVDGRRVTWKVRRAPGAGGTTCWRFDAKPAGRPAGSNGAGGARCVYPVAPDADPVDVPQFVQSNAANSPYGFVVFTAPKGTTKVRVGTDGGQFRNVSGSSPYVVVTKRSPLWVDLRLPGGPKLECPAGVLIDKPDLKDPVLWKPSIGAAWFCDVPGT